MFSFLEIEGSDWIALIFILFMETMTVGLVYVFCKYIESKPAGRKTVIGN